MTASGEGRCLYCPGHVKIAVRYEKYSTALRSSRRPGKNIFTFFKQKACPLRFFLTKADRILKRREYLALAKSGHRIQNEHFIANFSPNRLGRSRIGITVTKKVGSAVKRNRIKRLVREQFRLSRHQLAGTWDINIIAKRQAPNFPSEKVFRSMADIFERISKYDGHQ